MERGPGDRKRRGGDLRQAPDAKKRRLPRAGGNPSPRRRRAPNPHQGGYKPDRENGGCNRNEQRRRAVGFLKLETWSKEEAHKIILELIIHKQAFEEFLETKLSPDATVLIVRIIGKICTLAFNENKITFINVALKQNFATHLVNFILNLQIQDDRDRRNSLYFWKDVEGFFANLCVMGECLVDTLPTKACEILPKILNAITSTTGKSMVKVSEELAGKFLKLGEKLELCKVELERKKEAVCLPGEPGPPDDFRQISIYPTSEEITRPSRGFVRANVVEGAYKSVAHYLDVQFRLLREDFVAPLREGVCKFINRQAGTSSVRIYQDVKFIRPWFDKQAAGVLLQFTTKRSRKRNNSLLKRFMYGSLVCFTDDNFNTVIFGKIVARSMALLSDGMVVIGFEPGFDTCELDKPYVMVECSVYFEPYYHVLKGLQKTDETNFPMKDYIIDANPITKPPKYLQPDTVFQIQGLKVTVLSPDSWPTSEALHLDDTQYSAFKAGLTQQFAVIQGPPGTGKTYLGLKIAKALIENLTHQPILVVCFTNHALDQFLEGLLGTTHKILRVGGQSKNKSLEGFALKVWRRNRVGKSNVRVALGNIRTEVGGLLGNINNLSALLEEIQKFEGVIDFRHFVEVEPELMNSWFAFEPEGATIDWLFGARSNAEHHLQIWRPQQHEVPNEPQEDPDRELVERLDAEDRTKEIDEDDFNFDDLPQTFNKPTYLIHISKLTAKMALVSEDLAKCSGRRQRMEVQRELRKLEDGLNYLQMRLHQGKAAKLVTKPASSDLKRPQTMTGEDRWGLYFYWLQQYQGSLINQLLAHQRTYSKKFRQLTEIKDIDDIQIMRQMKVVGMTTTGAARLQTSLQELKCRTVIVEEAAEVLESHIIVSLTKHCEHLILIGDHQQLRPSTADYRMEHHFKLGISLFERMVRNKIQCNVLGVQHRMRPEIAKLIVPAIYPALENHASVHDFPPVLGVDPCMYFINHDHLECVSGDSSKLNEHEAHFLISLARYLVQNGYQPEEITILAAYSAQMFALWKERKNYDFLLQNVRITCLDNYQGEENRIILLSLVRNNKEGQIGFLKIENRVCVALSRAKEGFYMMGNMELLCQNSEIWPKIRVALDAQGFIGESLPLRCQIHQEVVLQAKEAKDFLEAPEGGCRLKCEMELKCGHKCPRICHATDREHARTQCKENCLITCENDHNCPKMCFETCGPCQVPMQKALPCTHEQTLPCHIDPDYYKCLVGVTAKLPCGHEVTDKPCHEAPETTKCTFRCDARIEPCGHACNRKCHINSDPTHLEYRCQKSCARTLADCSTGTHMCHKKCYEPCPPCPYFVKKARTCSHSSLLACWENVDEVACEERCRKKMACGHKCQLTCAEPCGRCQQQVEKKVAECGHLITIKCHQEPTKKYCKSPCVLTLNCGHPCQNKCHQECSTRCRKLVTHTKVAACGHNFKIDCYLLDTDLPGNSNRLLRFCREPCRAILACKHPCTGTCGECAQGRMHKICKEKCGVPLICGHECRVPCRQACQPCDRQCTYRCQHSACKKKCGEPCTNCTENCTRRCRHTFCWNKCGEICLVPPCREPCPKTLLCGHSCIGFCNDPCPLMCRICDKEEVTEVFLGYEDEDDARFVLLEECGHVIESKGMEEWLQQDGGAINCKSCPRCKTPLASTQRFSNYIKRAMEDVTAVKRKFCGADWENRAKQQGLFEKIIALEIKNSRTLCRDSLGMTKLMRAFRNKFQAVYKHRCKYLDAPTIGMYASKIQILETITDIFANATIKNSKSADKATIYLNFLLEFMSKEERITDQQIIDFDRELKRLVRIVQLCQIEGHSGFEYVISSKPDVKKVHAEINDLAFLPVVYSDEMDESLKNNLVDLNKQVQATIEITTKERQEIVRAMKMAKGHWYKCPNGHIYAIGECGGANQVGKCNECQATIGGQSHQLATGNQHAGEMDGSQFAAYSEAANNMFNYAEFGH